jgi:hypothetical protein
MANKKHNSKDNGNDRKRGSNKAPFKMHNDKYAKAADNIFGSRGTSSDYRSHKFDEPPESFKTGMPHPKGDKSPLVSGVRSKASGLRDSFSAKMNYGAESIVDPDLQKMAKGQPDNVGSAIRDMEIRGNVDKKGLKKDLKVLDAWADMRGKFGREITKLSDARKLGANVLDPINEFRKDVKRMPKELQNSGTVRSWMSEGDLNYKRAEDKAGISKMRATGGARERKVGYFRLGQWGGKARGDVADAAVAEAKMVEQEEGAGKEKAKARGGRKKAEAEEKEASIRMDRALSEEKYEGAKAKEMAMISEAKIGKRFLGFGPRYGGTIKTQRKTIAKSAEADQLEVEARRVEAQRQIEEAHRGRALLKGEAAMTGTSEEVSLRRRQLAGTQAVAEAFEEAGQVETGKGRIAKEEIDRFIEEMREGAKPNEARYKRLNAALKVARAEGSSPEFLTEAEGQMQPTQSATAQSQNWQRSRKRAQN